MSSISTPDTPPDWTEELEILNSIYPEISVEFKSPNECLVSATVYPATGDDEGSRHVMITLDFTLMGSYPNTLPLIKFRNDRGLSDVKLSELQDILAQKSEKLRGGSMLFQLRSLTQDFLTANNRPSPEIDCPICLSTFKKSDQFYRTTCYHYFHPNCLGQHLESIVKGFEKYGFGRMTPAPSIELTCPSCRQNLNEEFPGELHDIYKLLDAPPPQDDEEPEEFGNPKMVEEIIQGMSVVKPVATAVIPPSWLEQREAHKVALEKQKAQGGTVNPYDPLRQEYLVDETRLLNHFAQGNHGHNPFQIRLHYDSAREVVLSPSESGTYQITRLQDDPQTPNVARYTLVPPPPRPPPRIPNIGLQDHRYSRPSRAERVSSLDANSNLVLRIVRPRLPNRRDEALRPPSTTQATQTSTRRAMSAEPLQCPEHTSSGQILVPRNIN